MSLKCGRISKINTILVDPGLSQGIKWTLFGDFPDEGGSFPSQEAHDSYFESEDAQRYVGAEYEHYDTFMKGKGKAVFEIEQEKSWVLEF